MANNDPGKFKPKIGASFVNRNLVAIVMIPALIGVHYGWSLLQNNEALVSKEERIELPIITAAKLIWTKALGAQSQPTEK